MQTSDVKNLAKRISKSMKINNAPVLNPKTIYYEASCLQNPDYVTQIVFEVIERFIECRTKESHGNSNFSCSNS